MRRACRRHRLQPREISPSGRTRLTAYAWPGNVRELAHELERALVFEDGPLQFPLLPVNAGGKATETGGATGPGVAGSESVDWFNPTYRFPSEGFSLTEATDRLIDQALAQSRGNVSAAARLLGVSRDVVRYRLETRGDRAGAGGGNFQVRVGRRPEVGGHSPAAGASGRRSAWLSDWWTRGGRLGAFLAWRLRVMIGIMNGAATTWRRFEVDVEGEKEEVANMQTLQRFAVTAVFTLTCFTVPVLTASAGEAKTVQEEVGTIPRLPGANGEVATEVNPVQMPDWSKGTMADQLRALQDQFKKEQKDLITRYQDLLKRAKDASREERERVRELFAAERTALIEAQRELREQVKASFEEFRKDHSEHRDLIDAAKEKAKERIKERRGQGEME